jgi:hypothetical protein
MYIVCVCVRVRAHVCVHACMCTCMCGCKYGQINVLAISVYCVILRHWLGVDIGKETYVFYEWNMFITEKYSSRSLLWSARGNLNSCS